MKNEFKLTIDVNVNLSKETIAAFTSLFAGCFNGNPLPVKAEPVKAEPVKAEPVKAEPVKAEPVKAEPVKAVTLEDLRLILGDKVNDHREAIKEKLNSFGVTRITLLDASHYAEMYDFMVNL